MLWETIGSIGNRNNPWPLVEILTIERDSTDSAGNTYIKYQQYPYYTIRIDTAYNVFYEEVGPFGDPGLWYKLSAQIGDQWIVDENNPVYLRMWGKVRDIFQGVVFFNIPATVMEIDYWWETAPNDSFWVATHYLAEGFGLVEHIVEPYYSIFAAGAIINGIEYGILTGLEDNTNTIPDGFRLRQNYPNPFNPVTTIEYQITEPALVNLRVLNTLGQTVAILVNKNQLPGYYKVEFRANNLSSGLYYYRLQANEKTIVKKMMLLR